jgi:hypothetical protein
MATIKKKTSRKARRRGGQAILRLDAAFYPQTALKQAREAFSHLADIEIRKEGKKQVVKFGGMSATTAKRLPDEFANFALSRAVVEE